MTDEKSDLIGLSQSEIYESLIANDLIEAKDKFRAKQIWHWIYNKGETDFEKMSSISKELRSALPKFYQIKRPTIQTHEKSIDGTQKWLFKLHDGNLIETVFIPEDNRGTLCVSSQVGCTLNCTFCYTGTQKLVRNLTSEEIVSQLLVAKDELSDWSNKHGRKISNVVFMKTTFEIFLPCLLDQSDSSSLATSNCETISSLVKLRTNFCVPV